MNFSLNRSMFVVSILALAAMLCMPSFASSGAARTVAAAGQPAAVAVSSADSAAALPQPAATAALQAIAIHPSKIRTATPAGPAADGLTGPEGAVGDLGIPILVLQAYHRAADKLAVEQPSCKLPWWLLAGIGHTESGHAEGGRLTADGTTRGLILGPRLNGGIKGDAVISDTDHGLLDGDTIYDRAVGPMQFIPSTWARWGADGNGDGKKNPSNIFDATLAAAHYLCADGRNLSTPAGLDAAVLSYNHSAPYLATVLAWGKAYRDGASSIGNSPLPTIKDVTKARPPISARPHPPVHVAVPKPSAHPTSSASASPSSHPTATSSAPAPSCSDTATPTPTGTVTTSPTKSSSAVKSSAAGTVEAGTTAASQAAAAVQSADGGSATASGSSSSPTSSPSTSPSGCGH